MDQRQNEMDDPEDYALLPPVQGALAASSLAEMEMHAVARAALLNLLFWEDPDVEALFARWSEETPAGRSASRLIETSEAAALAAGFPGIHDLKQAILSATDGTIVLPATPTDGDDEARIVRIVRDYVAEAPGLFDALFAGVRGIDYEPLTEEAIALVRDRWRLPWPWLAVELVRAWVLWLGHAPFGLIATVQSIVEVDEWGAPAPDIAFATRPGETVGEAAERAVVEVFWPLQQAALSGALPTGRRTSPEVVERYTRWWYRARIRGESIRSVAGKVDDQRALVRTGIGRAERWLGIGSWTWADDEAERAGIAGDQA